MRCPKCGYISFDHLETCLKCKKNIAAAALQLNGTVFNVSAPAFLVLDQEPAGAEVDEIEGGAYSEPEDDGYVDDTLEILVNEREKEDDADFVFVEEDGEDLSFSADGREEEEEEVKGEIEIDFSQFEDSPAKTPADSGEDSTPKEETIAPEIPIPEELGDLSDLSPAAAKESAPVEEPVAEDKEKASEDLDLGDLDFDLVLGDLELPEDEKDAIGKAPAMALGDIDFSDTLELEKAEGGDAAEKNEEDDLDFDLDLGGLSLKKDGEA